MNKELKDMTFEELMTFSKESLEKIPPFPSFDGFKNMCMKIEKETAAILESKKTNISSIPESEWPSEWHRNDDCIENYEDRRG